MSKLACAVACLVLAAGAAHAGSPAAIPEAGRDRAGAAFDAFSAQWMARAHGAELAGRANPSVAPGTATPLVTYRGYGDDYALELRPTGNPNAPYVGLLRYTEHVYSCSSVDASDCTIVSSVPMTEIFRYLSGRWRY
jgi:hypothetical protein